MRCSQSFTPVCLSLVACCMPPRASAHPPLTEDKLFVEFPGSPVSLPCSDGLARGLGRMAPQRSGRGRVRARAPRLVVCPRAWSAWRQVASEHAGTAGVKGESGGRGWEAGRETTRRNNPRKLDREAATRKHRGIEQSRRQVVCPRCWARSRLRRALGRAGHHHGGSAVGASWNGPLLLVEVAAVDRFESL